MTDAVYALETANAEAAAEAEQQNLIHQVLAVGQLTVLPVQVANAVSATEAENKHHFFFPEKY